MWHVVTLLLRIIKELGRIPRTRETCMQVKKQQLEPDMEQQTGSILGKEYIKAVYCHLAYLTSMQSKYIMWTQTHTIYEAI